MEEEAERREVDTSVVKGVDDEDAAAEEDEAVVDGGGGGTPNPVTRADLELGVGTLHHSREGLNSRVTCKKKGATETKRKVVKKTNHNSKTHKERMNTHRTKRGVESRK